MRWILSLVGAVLAFVGAFWFLQGINVIPIGFMAGQSQYAILGFVIALAGIVLIVFANRRIVKTGANSHDRTGTV